MFSFFLPFFFVCFVFVFKFTLPHSHYSNKWAICPFHCCLQKPISVFGIFPGVLGICLCVPVLCKTLRSQRAALIGHQDGFSKGQIDLNLIVQASWGVSRKHFQELFKSFVRAFVEDRRLSEKYFFVFLPMHRFFQQICYVKIIFMTFIRLFK